MKRTDSGDDLTAYATIPIPISREIIDEYSVQTLPHNMRTADIVSMKIKEESISEGPFYVVDLGMLTRKYEQWTGLLPRVKPFYAVKCNPNEVMVKTLAHLGAGFDCASQGEIMQVLSYGVHPERVIMANPCKPASHITSAKNLGVSMMTFDNVDELHKIKKLYPRAELVMRILTDDSHSVMRFGSKFGAPPCAWVSLLKLARDLGLNVIGISFHVGSGCMSPVAFTEALRRARTVFDLGKEFGFDFTLLDIGGGFPGVDTAAVSFTEIALALAPVLDELFPPHVRVIGEPGRFFAGNTHVLAVSVYARRQITREASEEIPNSDDLRYLYYVNDGVYGSFNCIFFDHAHPEPFALKESSAQHRSKIFGPTCDSLDVICASHLLPELEVGDWLYFPEMGAYTTAAASRFNGFKTTTFFYVYTLSAPTVKLD